jgi:rare lipoprotein A
VKKPILFVVVLLVIMFVAKAVNVRKEKKLRVLYVLKTSWYGPGFHGRRTASGERYNMYALTAAHRNWRFGEKLRLINPTNNRSVIVTVTDRGPYDPRYLRRRKLTLVPHPDRDLDISYQAARQLGMVRKGVEDLFVEVIEQPP